MTVPRVRTVNSKAGRFYVDPTTAEKVPGVTSITGQLPKEFLRYWASREVAAYAYDHRHVIADLERSAAISLVKSAPDRDTKRAAAIGTAAHAAFEALANGEEPDAEPFHDKHDLYRDTAALADVQAMTEHFRDFLATWRPEYVLTEATLWSDAHKYAGTADAIAQMDGETVLLDYKTTRSGVHDEVALQLTAYARADFVLRPDGTRVPPPQIASAAVIHVRPEGWKVVPVRIGDDIFETFLALRKVFDWSSSIHSTVLGTAITPTTNAKENHR